MVLYVLQGVCGALQCLVHAEGSVWSTAVFCMCCRECVGHYSVLYVQTWQNRAP